jgi:large repetitive protein
VLHNHIPLDPLTSGALLVSKTGDKSVAEVADSVRYFIRIRNTTNGSIAGVKLEDLLPAGFRYISGTARLNNNVLADPAGGIGRALTFDMGSVGAIPGNTTWELSYFVRLGVGSQQGDGINRATAVFQGVNGPVRSNTAQFRVRVDGGVFGNEGCIAGKVYVDCDGNAVQSNASGSRELGIPGVRLVMLDGTQITTDSEGKYSICGVKPQTHVIKVDRTTMPNGSRLLPSSNRNAGVGDSIFVDLKGGELARADFIEGSCSPDVLDQIKVRRAQGGVLSPEKEIAPDVKIDNRPPQSEQQTLPSVRPDFPTPANTGGKTP